MSLLQIFRRWIKTQQLLAQAREWDRSAEKARHGKGNWPALAEGFHQHAEGLRRRARKVGHGL